MSKNKGFTLIELLVVIGIIAILAVAALIAINPLEAQRKARDSARLQDMSRLSAAMEAYINDAGYGALVDKSSGTVTVRSQPCTTASWLGVDLCEYLKSIPVDPSNAKTISIVASSGGTTRTSATARYGFTVSSGTGTFAFCTYLEAEGSRELLNDGAPTDNNFDTSSFACTP